MLLVWVSPLTAQGPPCPIKSSSVMTGFSVRGSRLNGFSVRVRGSVTTGKSLTRKIGRASCQRLSTSR